MNMQGQRIAVLWRGDPASGGESVWYPATITAYDPNQDPLSHLVTYDDGDREWCDLETLEWREEESSNNSNMNNNNHHSNNNNNNNNNNNDDDNINDGNINDDESMLYPSGGEPSEFLTVPPNTTTNTTTTDQKREEKYTEKMTTSNITTTAAASAAATFTAATSAGLAATRVETAKQMLDQLEMTAAALRAKSLAFQHQKEAHAKYLNSAKTELHQAVQTRVEEVERRIQKQSSTQITRLKRLLSTLRSEQGSAQEAIRERQTLEDALDSMATALKKSNGKILVLQKKLKKQDVENGHLRKKMQVLEWRTQQQTESERDSAASEASSALKVVKREQRRLREMRKQQRRTATQQRQQRQQRGQQQNTSGIKERAFGGTFVRDEDREDEDNDDPDDDESVQRYSKKKRRKRATGGIWATRKESLVRLVFSLIRAVDSTKLKNGTKSLPGVACLLQMSQTDHDTRSFAGPTTHAELLRLAWGCIDGALTLPGFDEGIKGAARGGQMVPGPDCQRLLHAIFGSSTATNSNNNNSSGVTGVASSSLEEFSSTMQDTGGEGGVSSTYSGPSFLRDPTLVNPITSSLMYPDVEVVVLSSLIVLRCSCRVEYHGAALEALSTALRTEEGKRRFIQWRGMHAVIPMLGSVNIKRRGHPGLLGSMVAVLLNVVREGEHLAPFLRTLTKSVPFFAAASRAFRLDPSGNMHNQIMRLPDLQVMEALSMVLERLSRFSERTHTLFVRAGLVPKLKEWSRVLRNEVGEGAHFLVMNADAILKRVSTKRKHPTNKNASSSRGGRVRGRGGGSGGGGSSDSGQESVGNRSRVGGQAMAKRVNDKAQETKYQQDTQASRFASPILSVSPPRSNKKREQMQTHEDNEDNEEMVVYDDADDANTADGRVHEQLLQRDLDDQELEAIESELYSNGANVQKGGGPLGRGGSVGIDQGGKGLSPNRRTSPARVSPARVSPARQTKAMDRSPSRSPVPLIYDNVEDAESYLVGQALGQPIGGNGGLQKKSPAMRAVQSSATSTSPASVQSPERSTDDLLAFYNRLISKARALHEDENDIEDEEDELFAAFQDRQNNQDTMF